MVAIMIRRAKIPPKISTNSAESLTTEDEKTRRRENEERRR
jgi:hypothetical protein